MFNWVDFIICAFVIQSVLDAWKNGFITSVVNTAGFVVSIIAARIFYADFADYLDLNAGLAFVILVFILQMAFSICAFVLNSISKLPVLNEINKLFCLAFGALRGMLVVSVVLAFVAFTGPIVKDTSILTSVKESYIGSVLYEHNVIVYFLGKFI